MSSNPSSKSTVAGFNPRAVAALFRMDVMEYFDQWNAGTPMRTGFPHASGILAPEGDFCPRKLILMALYPTEAIRPDHKPWDTLTNARFKNGWILHEKYQSLLKHYGRVVYTAGDAELDLTHFHEKYSLHFSPDAIVEHCGEQMVVEIKGYKAESYEKMDEAGDAPKDAHNQANLYMHLLGLKHALILVENKNTQEIKTWCVEYDLSRAQPFIDRLEAFEQAYWSGTTPERKCSSKDDRLAQKCEMRDWCFSHR